MAPKKIVVAQIPDDAQAHEDQHVHAVYDEIASHFSSTRYKPWPIIAQFMSTLPTGSIGLDSGTGNGKYLPLPLDRPSGSIWTIGLDRSRNLLDIARTAGSSDSEDLSASTGRREVVWGDVLGKGWREGSFDYAISIATIHHLATPERRKKAVQRLLQCISPMHGRLLIYVWAIEQDELSKRDVPSDSYDGMISITSGLDVFIPWVLTKPDASKEKSTPKAQSNHRSQCNIASQTEQSHKVPDKPLVTEPPRIYNRYYHMFAEGELSELVRDAASELDLQIGPHPKHPVPVAVNRQRGVEIVQDGWERSNYFVELRRWQS